MRRSEREVKDHERLLGILEACDCLRLAIADEEAPYIVPVNFGWEEQEGRLRLFLGQAQSVWKPPVEPPRVPPLHSTSTRSR